MVFKLTAPLSGILVPIESIPDPVFSQKVLGNGISIDPTSEILLSPCDGQIMQLHKCLHALTIKTKNNLEVMIHIGIDTVNLRGEGFLSRVKVGDEVVTGQPLIEFQADNIAKASTSLLTQIIFLNSDVIAEYSFRSGRVIAAKDSIIEVILKQPQKPIMENAATKNLVTSKEIKVINPNGFHARPVAVLVASAKKYSAEISIKIGSKSANAKSVVSILSLDIKHADTIALQASGPDASLAISELITLIEGGLGELSTEKVSSELIIKKVTPLSEHLLGGVCASPGLAVGNVFQIRSDVINVVEAAQDIFIERSRLANALDVAKGQLSALQDALRKQSDSAKAAIFSAHEEILSDPEILSQVNSLILSGKTAEFSWKQVYTQQAQNLAKLNNELLAARANDIRDVGQRVLHVLVGVKSEHKIKPPHDAILIAEDITPSDTAELDPTHVRGFCTVAGGPSSHVAILARSLGIPVITGMDPRALDIASGTPVILDATNAVLNLKPSTEDIAKIQTKQIDIALQKTNDLKLSSEKAITKDGVQIEVAANIGNLKDADQCLNLGADGVGLLRSEFLFFGKNTAPSEEDQFKIYQKIVQALGPQKPFIIRTLDIGGDKPLSYLPIPKEENPFLGERGIRVGLNRPEILKTQIRAILRAADNSKIMIMFPMISCIDEILTTKQLVHEQAQLLGKKSVPPIGIMVEVPSSAIMANQFAPHVDFFSIGTNDLTQYTLAIDRGHPKLASKADGLDPSVLRLIQMTNEAAAKNNKWVGVCGGIASEPIAIPILIGLGVHELSVSVPSIPRIKSIVRSLKKSDCDSIAKKAIEKNSAFEVRALVNSFYKDINV